MKPFYKILMLCAILFLAANSNAQDSKKLEKSKSHIVIITNENGKESRIDTTFSSEVAMKEFLKDHEMDTPTPPEPPMPPDALAPPEPPMPPNEFSNARKVTQDGKNVVYTYRYNYDNDEGENNNLIISFNKKDFNDMIDRLKSTITELEKDKNISQKSLQKELQELKKSLQEITAESKVLEKTVKKVIIKNVDKE